MYLELANNDLNFVERSTSTGSLVETRVAKANWNIDPLDGTGPSNLTLDITKSQILWMDIEWLGLGTVRLGFVINGKFIHCHSFHHANIITGTYITTASLPLRYEITNTAATASTSTLKQVCSTVLSEGGYELRGLQQSIGTTITSPAALTLAGTYYPIISLRLKSARLDAIVILTAISIMAASANVNYTWRVVASATTTGGTWTSAGTNSSVEYNLTGTATTGGRVLAEGYFSSTNQSTTSVDILKEALFKFQLERDGLTSTPYELSLLVAASVATSNVHASMDWEEISR
jgi:acyl-CoA thioesterase FadM